MARHLKPSPPGGGVLRLVGNKPQSATSAVYHRLRWDIMQGQLEPGEKLRIEILRDRYDVGNSPIREALSRLCSEDLVISEDQKGFRVANVSIDDLNDLTRSRCLLNEIVLREAIASGSDDWEEAIVIAFHRMNRVAKAKDFDVDLWDHHHRVFHDALIASCGSKWLRNMSGVLYDRAERYRKLSRAFDPSRDVEREHSAIMEATINRDTAAAIRLLNDHTILTANVISNVWGNQANESSSGRSRIAPKGD